MSKIDDYNKLVNFIGNIIKASDDPEDQDGIDDALDIAHTIGDALEVFTDDKQKK